MKALSSAIQGIKIVIKYASYIVVIIDILEYASKKLETIPQQKIEEIKK